MALCETNFRYCNEICFISIPFCVKFYVKEALQSGGTPKWLKDCNNSTKNNNLPHDKNNWLESSCTKIVVIGWDGCPLGGIGIILREGNPDSLHSNHCCWTHCFVFRCLVLRTVKPRKESFQNSSWRLTLKEIENHGKTGWIGTKQTCKFVPTAHNGQPSRILSSRISKHYLKT